MHQIIWFIYERISSYLFILIILLFLFNIINNLFIITNFLQVLPHRTHPKTIMSSFSGYIIYGYKISEDSIMKNIWV